MDEVDVAAERVRGADRDVQRRDLGPERLAQGVERRARVGVLAVALVEHETRRRVGRAAHADRRLEPGLDAARRVHHEQRRVGRVEALDHLGREVRVARRVDDGDLVLAVLERADREAERLVALLLLGLVVEVGGPVVHPALARDRAGTKEDLFRERRLAATGVAREHDGADVGEVVALDRHRALYLVVTRIQGSRRRSGAMGT
jgi:hypothetical protein